MQVISCTVRNWSYTLLIFYLTTLRTGIVWSGIISTLRAGFSRIYFYPWKGQQTSLTQNVQTCTLNHLPSYSVATKGSFWWNNKVDHLPYVVSRLRISGSIPPIPPMPSCLTQEKLRPLLFYLTRLPISDFILRGTEVWLLHWERCLRIGLCYSLRYCSDLKLKRLMGNQ